ncbi:MAG: aldo/keto reductase [Haloarculaceae archaeon]
METITTGDVSFPALGLGTWRLTDDQCVRAVEMALDLGYRHVDTAQAYGNEREVGTAIERSDVDREDVFLTTKLDWSNRRYDDVLRSTEESLARLGTSYVDLLLVHQPNPTVPLKETLDAMTDLRDAGKVRHVGVSNFSLSRLQRARDLSTAPIVTDQVMYHPYWDQTDLLDHCQIHDLVLTAYSPLAHGSAIGDDRLAEIGERYGKSAAQVALRWLVQQANVAVVPKATSREHLAANREIFDFELTPAEMRAVHRPSKLRTALGFVQSRLPGSA